ncbi:hypothetical protein MMC14_006751 [Varicellaria rhodocarpa]|nr:hypothetical protein [Varicellaria rhodocarpa]
MSYGGNVNRGPFLNIINWIFNAVALIAVLLRLASRRMLEKKGWAIDDLFIILTIAVSLARAIHVSVAISKGFGRHLDTLLEENPIETTRLLRLLVILQAIGLWTFTLPKLPVVALLTRLFGTTRRVATVLYSMAIFLIVLATILTILTFIQCSPVAHQWNPLIPGHCYGRSINVDFGYLVGTYSAILDFAFALYPILQVSKLQMERSRKILIGSSLSLGFVACIVTIYKQTLISEIENVGDPTWATIPLEVWNSVEGTALIVAASVPLTRPILLMIGQGIRSLTSRLSSINLWSVADSLTDMPTKSSALSSQSPVTSKSGSAVSRHYRSMFKPGKKDDILLLETQRHLGGSDDGRSSSQNTTDGRILRTVDLEQSVTSIPCMRNDF